MANPITDQPIHAALEVLRTGHDDLADPDLAHVAQAIEQDPQLADRLARIERTDEKLASTFHDVAVPAGLEDRLLSQLAASEMPIAAADESQLTVARSRRVFWASAVAVAASIATAIFLWPRGPEVDLTSRDMLLDQAIAFYSNETPVPGVSLAAHSPPVGFATSSDVRHAGGATWRRVDDFLGSPAVAYDLVGPRGEQATLYVARRRLVDLRHVTLPSIKPALSTGGVSATCWQNDDVLYVLVVSGEREQYDEFVRQPGSTVACRLPASVRFAQAA